MQVELEIADIQNLLSIVNQSMIKGQDAETIANLKIKLRQALPAVKNDNPQPEEGGEQ